MAFRKGQSGNPAGRPVGAKDRQTAELRQKINEILGEHFTPEKIAADIEAMEPKDRLTFLTKLMEYAVPKLKQTELDTDNRDTDIHVIFPTFPEDRAERIKELKQKLFETDE